jgi:hypothetical protein
MKKTFTKKNKEIQRNIETKTKLYKNGVFYNKAQFLLGGLIKIKALAFFWLGDGVLSNRCILPLSKSLELSQVDKHNRTGSMTSS